MLAAIVARNQRTVMAVKTITIDIEAYELLAGARKGDESFSKVIKRRLRAAGTANDLLRELKRVTLAEETLDRVEEAVARRVDSPACSPVIEMGD